MNENNPNPFEQMYDKIEELIRLATDKALQPVDNSKIPTNVNERLEKVEREIDKFDKLTQKIVQLSGVSKEELDKRLMGKSEEISEEGNYLIKKGNKLIKEVEQLQENLGKFVEDATEQKEMEAPFSSTPADEKPVDAKKFKGKRRSKFKRFGSNKNWKPL